MIFVVNWLPSAVNELAELWVNALDRRAVTEASDRMEQLLTKDAHQLGVGFQDHRLLLVAPLVLAFAVDLVNRQVRVLNVQRCPSSNGSIS